MGEVADGRPIELRIDKRVLCAGSVGLRGSTVVNVAEGATNVTSVLAGKSTEGILPDGTPTEGTPPDAKLIDAILADETPIVGKLADGTVNEFTPTATIGTLTGATVGTVTATYFTLADTGCGGPAAAELVLGTMGGGRPIGFAEMSGKRTKERRELGMCMVFVGWFCRRLLLPFSFFRRDGMS